MDRVVLSIAGSDSSAGAGIQQDLKTVTSMGGYCATVLTAVTAQNTVGVTQVMPVPADVLAAQLEAVLGDMPVAAVKTGMIPNRQCAETIVGFLRTVKCPIVCDPVMISTSGTPLMDNDCIDYLKENLFPLCCLVTPNMPEAERLSLPKDALGRYNVLIKGGHAEGSVMRDRLVMADGSEHLFSSLRISTGNLHGTGCTLSSAIAAALAEGLSLPAAVQRGKEIINKGIEGGRNLHVGQGNGPLWLF